MSDLVFFRYGYGEPYDNRLEGINNLVHAFATLDDANPEIEGNFIGQMLRDNEIYLDAYLTDEQMGLLFDFERQQGYYTPDEIVEVNFVNNIGSILWDRGIDFSMLTDRYGRDAALAALNGQSYDYTFRRMVYDLKNTLELDSSQEVWLIEHQAQAEMLNTFIQNQTTNNQIPEDVKTLAEEIIAFGNDNSLSSIANQFILDVLNTYNSHTFFDLNKYLNQNTLEIEEGLHLDCCPDNFDPLNPNRDTELILMLGIDLIVSFGDAAYSMLLRLFEWMVTDEYEGSFVKDMFEYKQIDIPFDIDNETLGALFKVRYENQEIVVLYDSGVGADLIELGTNLLDVLSIISPSKGGGAFLAINGGEKITVASFKQFLKLLKESYFRPVGDMVGKRIGHTFSKHGLHNTILLQSMAKNSGIPQGQWLDELIAEDFIARHLDQLSNGTRDIPIPESLQNIGRVFRGGDGFILAPTHIRLVPSGSGVKTAYPINETITTLQTLGTYVP